MAKVKVTLAIFRKTLSLLYRVHFWTDFNLTSHKYKYDNILNNFEFEGFRDKVKVTVAIYRKTLPSL